MSQWHCSPGFQLVVPFWMSDREILFTYNIMLLEDWKIFSRPSVDATACYQFDQLQHPLISLEINLIDKLYSQTPSSALSHIIKTFWISLYFIVTRSYFVISFLLLLWHYISTHHRPSCDIMISAICYADYMSASNTTLRAVMDWSLILNTSYQLPVLH